MSQAPLLFCTVHFITLIRTLGEMLFLVEMQQPGIPAGIAGKKVIQDKRGSWQQNLFQSQNAWVGLMWEQICVFIPVIYAQHFSLLPHKHKQHTHKEMWRQKWEPVLPSLEEMVKADRQKSTATTFRSMAAQGMKGGSRTAFYTHTSAHTHVQRTCTCPPTSPSYLTAARYYSHWCWVSECAWESCCSVQAVTGLMSTFQGFQLLD